MDHWGKRGKVFSEVFKKDFPQKPLEYDEESPQVCKDFLCKLVTDLQFVNPVIKSLLLSKLVNAALPWKISHLSQFSQN